MTGSALALYRDDGPLARGLARVLGPLGAAPQSLTLAAAIAPMLVMIALEGAGASETATGLTLAWFVVIAGASARREPTDSLRWAVPPLLRTGEYAGLLWIGAQGGELSEPAALALICVLTFRHYDLVYRLRHQGVAPPEWIGNLALGWDGRLVLGYILLVADALPAGLYIAAGLFATAFVAESIAGWRRFGRGRQPVTHEDEEDEAQ